MECKACGTWFVRGQNDGVCLSCKTRLKKMGLDIPYDRLRVLVEADRDGRCVVLPQKTVFELKYMPGEYCDMICPITIAGEGQCGFCEFGVEIVHECVCKQEHIEQIGKDVFLTRESAEAALKGEQDG